MDTSPHPFEPGAALARIDSTPSGYVIDCRGPYGARHYDLPSAEEAAELAVIIRDTGGWPLRFGPRAAAVRSIVEEIDEDGD